MDLFWTGTDVLFMNQYPNVRFRFKVKIFFFRLLVKALNKWYTGINWVISEHLRDELNLSRPMKIYEPPIDLTRYAKVQHKTFNILYYFPTTGRRKKGNIVFHQWLYGYDIYLKLKEYFDDDVTWIMVDGSDDMSGIYPIIDFCIRPNRHDGSPFMIRECEANSIPYYWSKENPDISQAITAIEETING